MTPPRIVGIVLVRDEDLHVGRAVRNVAAFCDRLIICDHASSDRTPAVLQDLASDFSHVSIHLVDHPRASHEMLKPFCGTDTWVFGVDGDEIYDPAGLALLKAMIQRGDFARVWRIKGNVLHVSSLDSQTASGFAAPPSRSITKLYNFSAIRAWDGDTIERLHGGRIEFAPGWNDGMKRNLQDETAWEDSRLRCLHLCFLPRSSRDAGARPRANIMETHGAGWRGLLNKWTGAGRWKREHYRKGEPITVDATPFFPS